ncbi:MAG TPA: hypothetical protein VFI25_19640 [Planctomycetota bacterium]|nr:hypothetical protein [Planctomycetota bacterium]
MLGTLLSASLLIPGSVTLKNGEKLEALRVEESPAEVVLHLDRGTITLPRKEVATIDAGVPAAPAAQPDRVRHKSGGVIEGVVMAQEKDLVRVRVLGGIAEIDAPVVAGIDRGTLKEADLAAMEASGRDRLARAEAERRDALARYAASLGAGRGNRGEALPAAFGAESETPAESPATLLDEVLARRDALRAAEILFRTGPYPERLLARQAFVQQLFPAYVPGVYDPVLSRRRAAPSPSLPMGIAPVR